MRQVLGGVGMSLAVGLLGLATAHAHGRLPGTKQVAFHPSNPDIIAVEGTFGTLVTRNGGETWGYVCTGVMGSDLEEDQTITVMEDGSIVTANDKGVRRGTMNGCSWSVPQSDLDTIAPDQTIVRQSGSSTRVLLSSGTTPEELWRTDDNGETWEQEGNGIEPAAFSSHSIAVAPSASNRIYVGGAMPTGQGKVFRSTDGGESWEGFDVSLQDPEETVVVMAVNPTDPDHVFVRAKHNENDNPTAQDRLLRSTDGGETWTEVRAFEVLRAVEWSGDGETVWAGETDIQGGAANGLFRSMNGGESFERVSDREIECLSYHEGELWACGNDFSEEGYGLGRSSDGGETFEPVLEFTEICGILECPMDADVQSCGPAAGDAQNDINADQPQPTWATAPACSGQSDAGRSGSNPSGGGCSCTVGRSALPGRGLATFLVLLVLPGRRWLRRRGGA